MEREVTWEEIAGLYGRDEVVLNCADADVEQRMKAEVEKAIEARDTVGGVFEVRAHNIPPGLGTYANWDERLDGLPPVSRARQRRSRPCTKHPIKPTSPWSR